MIRTCLLILGILFWSHAVSAATHEPIRPGDLLAVQLPGEAEFNAPFQVDSRGRIALPEIGTIAVSGLTPDAAKEKIKGVLGVVMKNLDRLDVFVKERRVLVTVLGYVEKPGPVDLPEGANVQMALNAAGGLKAGAQLDKVQVRRGGRVISFDYKHYLDTGDPLILPQLHPLDHIFVPASPLTGKVQVDFDAQTLTAAGDAADGGSGIIVFGEVHRPGSFAYKPGSTVIDMLMRAGGVTRYAAVDQIRVITGGTPVPFNLREYLDTGRKDLLPALKPGGTIFVPQIAEQVKSGGRAIRIIGAVSKPGRYDWSADMSFLDLIAIAGGPRAEADTAHVRILTAGDNGNIDSVRFNLKRFLDQGGNISSLPKISAGDTVVVPELPKDPNDNRSQWTRQSSERSIYVFGSVGAPGRYAFNEELNFLDILSAAQGPTAQADLRNVRITHRSGTKTGMSKVNLSLYFRTGDESELPTVLPEDVIFIPERGRDWRDKDKKSMVRVLGSVNSPGRYPFDDSMTILDLLAEAGGPSDKALQDKIVVVTHGTKGPTARTFDLIQFARTGDFTMLPVLRPGDTVYIPDQSQSTWSIVSKGLRDAVSALALVLLIVGL